MYSLGCYSSNLASYGATCRSVSDYGPSSAPYISEHSEPRRASSFNGAKKIPDSNSSIASARVNKLPAGQLSGTFFVSSLKIPSASPKTSRCSITLSSGPSSAESRLSRRQANKKLELVSSSGRNRTQEAVITDEQPHKISSSTSLLETFPSAIGAIDGSSSSEMKWAIDEGLKCSSSVTPAFENQAWDSKHVKTMLISTSSGPQTVTGVAQEHLSSSSDCEKLVLATETEHSSAAHARNSGYSSSLKRQCTESEILEYNTFSSTTSIDDQRAESEVAEHAPTLHTSKRFMSDALEEPSTSFIPGALLTPDPISEQQISFSSHLFTDQESKLTPTSTDEKQGLEFFDSHFADAETELNSMTLPRLFPVIDIVEAQPVAALPSLSEHQISIGESNQSNCIDMAEPYIHLKSILKTTTKYPGTTKKTLSIQGAIAWYVSYYWNYSKGAKNSTVGGAVAVADDGVVHHRTKINDDRAVRDNELADGGYFSDLKPENDNGIPAPMDVVKRVTFAEPMVTTVHHYVGAQRQKRTSPNVKS